MSGGGPPPGCGGTPSWEISKENYQPLKSGRKASAVERPVLSSQSFAVPSTPMSATKEEARAVKAKIDSFEAALRSYSGTDPLSVWHEYIVWVEQTGRREGNLQKLLENCIKDLKDDKRYTHDGRFMDVWAKYANTTDDPAEVFGFMYKSGICTVRPELYVNWAWVLEQAGNVKKAERVFKQGVQNVGEDHREELKKKQHHFQARTMKNVLHEAHQPAAQAAASEEERTALAHLRAHGKKTQKVGSVRVGSEKLSEAPGTMPVAAAAPSGSSSGAKKPLGQSQKFQIFSDSSSLSAAPKMPGQQQQKENQLPTDKRRNQENTMNPGKWTESRMGRKTAPAAAAAAAAAAVPARPSFSVHQDESIPGAPQPQQQQSTFRLESRVLKAKDDGPPVPLAVFEPPDPSKRPMYAKHLVYQGATEFSFEELRAIKIRKRVEEERLRTEKEELARIASECAEKQSEIKRQQEAFREEQERFAQRQADMLREQERMMLEMQRAQKEEYERQKEELLRLQSQVGGGHQQGAPRGVAPIKDDSSSLMEDTAMLLQAVNPASSANRLLSRSGASGGGSAQNSLQKTPPRCDSAGNLVTAVGAATAAAAFVQPSPTVNTREAFKLAQGMWREESVREEAPPQPPPPPKTPAFPIYSDETSAANPPPVIAVNPPPAAPSSVSKAPFAVFQDAQDTAAAKRRRPKLQPRLEGDKENQLPVSDSMKENEPPAPLDKQPQSTRATAGILQPSTNVPFVPLEIQEAVLDEDERTQELAMAEAEEEVNDHKTSSFEKMPPPPALPVPKAAAAAGPNPNVTIALPSMEAFEEMARLASTPYHGRRTFDEEDDDDELDPNTCAVDIVFKKPKGKGQPEPQGQQQQQQPETEQEQERPPSTGAAFIPLSPLMETSREYKSSSSSGQSLMTTTQNALTKSHWGNTHLGCTTASSMAARTPASSLFLSANPAATTGGAATAGRRQMGAAPTRGEMTCSSGYMADSSARTPGNFLVNARKEYVDQEEEEAGGAKRAEATPNKGVEKKQKMSDSFNGDDDDDEEEEEMTGIADMMFQMKRDTKATKAAMAAKAQTAAAAGAASSFLSVSVSHAAEKSAVETMGGGNFLQESLQPSLLDNTGFAELSRTKSMLMPVPPASLGASMAASFSGHRSLGDSPALDVTAPALDVTAPTGEDDTTPRDMEEEDEEDNAVAVAEQVQLQVSRLAISSIDMESIQDPFDEALQQKLLGQIPIPLWSRHGYHKLSGQNLPAVRTHKEVVFGGASFLIGECKGEGAYGKVFKAMKSDNKDETIADMDVVVKIQKPACEWEFYIGTEIHSRLSAMGASSDDKARFMSIPRCFTFEDGSALVSEHQQGTLLDVVNAMASERKLHEAVAVFFLIEMLMVAQKLRELDIIHGDIKPDNFLLLDMPPLALSSNATSKDDFYSKLRPSIQLIDFGRCVDLNMFPRGKTFSHVFSKPDLRTPEMLEGRPWSHQIDYFGVASTVYVLLSGSYMKLVKNKDGKNFPSGPMRRWWNGEIWTSFFTEFLNIRSADELPDLAEWLVRFQDFFFASKMAQWSEIHGIIKSALRR